jgi:hypothetical protein
MEHKEYHLAQNPLPDGFRIFQDYVPIMGLPTRRADAIAFCKGSERNLRFQLEPNNPHDLNAIKVIGEWNDWRSRKEATLGYVPAEIALKLATSNLAGSVRPRLMKTYVSTEDFVEIEFQVIGPQELYNRFNPPPPPKILSPEQAAAEDEAALSRFDELTTFLRGSQRLTTKQIEKLRREESRKRRDRMLETSVPSGQASDAPSFLNFPKADFRSHLQSIDNDLYAQVEIVDDSCRAFFRTGEVPAPYYPWRVAVILSKRKMKGRERDFLEGWCRHFSDGNGVRYEDLVKRAEKLGINVPEV